MQIQTARTEMFCGACGREIPEGDDYWFHSTGMIECLDCHDINEQAEQDRQKEIEAINDRFMDENQ